MSARVLVATLLLAAFPAAAEEWAVLGLKDPAGAPVGPAVETARGALGLALGDGGRVLGPEELRARLGLGPPGLAGAKERLDAAELYYFQLELDAARENARAAVAVLERAGGDPEAWDRLRLARLLLAMIHLAEGGAEAEARAEAAIEPLVRVGPEHRPSPRAYPAEIIALHDRVRERLAAAPRGRLRVRCAAPCPAGQVWLDGAPRGLPLGGAVELPPGRYHVAVTDAFERPSLRSLTREVELAAGEEVVVDVDLEAEGALDPADGPALLAPPDATARAAASLRAGAWARVPRLLAVWSDGVGERRRLHVAVVEEPAGRIARQASALTAAGGDAAAIEALVRFAVSGEAGPGVDPAGSGGDLAAAHAPAPAAAAGPVPAAAPAPDPGPPGGRTLAWAKWSTLAGAAVLGGAAGLAAADANRRDEELADKVARWGGVVPAAHEAEWRADWDAIRGRRTATTALLVSAGVSAGVSALLFVLDGTLPAGAGEEAPPSR